jgi:hypothetical protein
MYSVESFWLINSKFRKKNFPDLGTEIISIYWTQRKYFMVFPTNASRYNFRNLVLRQTGRNKNTHLLSVDLPRFVSL